MIKVGTLIELKDGTKAIAVTGTYTHRFMEAQDYEMEEHGMGQYAGVYASAFDVVFPETGKRRRIRCGLRQFKLIVEPEEEA
jgi:hypothetical protein